MTLHESERQHVRVFQIFDRSVYGFYRLQQSFSESIACQNFYAARIYRCLLYRAETPFGLRQGMSLLRQAARHSRYLQEPLLARFAALAQSQIPYSSAPAVQQRPFSCSSSCQSPVHIEDEPYCRQRQLLVLGNRVPVLAPDSWVAPNAVVIGDVDLFDKVCASLRVVRSQTTLHCSSC